MINWEEFGRSQLARTVLNLSQLGRREASDLAFHRKAVARKMTGPHSHRGGHWFDPSIAHPAQRPVAMLRLAVFLARTTLKFGGIEVDQFPGEPEHFALA